MSQPNPTSNPDSRPLPPGWITQYDPNYKAWYYVNTLEQPPRSIWVHPLGPVPPPPGPPPSQYAPPTGPPPPSYNQGPQYGGGYNNPPQGNWGASDYGSGYRPQNDNNRGWFGGHHSQPPPPPQVAYTQAQPRKSGIGVGTAIAAGGAGLLGGALLANAWGEHNEELREESYERGYEDGQEQESFDDGGGDFGGDFF